MFACFGMEVHTEVTVQVGFSLILNPITRIINLSRAFCDPGPRSNQIMSAAQHLALKNTIQIRARIMEIGARIMEIGANYKMALSDVQRNNISKK